MEAKRLPSGLLVWSFFFFFFFLMFCADPESIIDFFLLGTFGVITGLKRMAQQIKAHADMPDNLSMIPIILKYKKY